MSQLSDLFHTQSFKFIFSMQFFSIDLLVLEFKVALHKNYLSDPPETYRAYSVDLYKSVYQFSSHSKILKKFGIFNFNGHRYFLQSYRCPNKLK